MLLLSHWFNLPCQVWKTWPSAGKITLFISPRSGWNLAMYIVKSFFYYLKTFSVLFFINIFDIWNLWWLVSTGCPNHRKWWSWRWWITWLHVYIKQRRDERVTVRNRSVIIGASFHFRTGPVWWCWPAKLSGGEPVWWSSSSYVSPLPLPPAAGCEVVDACYMIWNMLSAREQGGWASECSFLFFVSERVLGFAVLSRSETVKTKSQLALSVTSLQQ